MLFHIVDREEWLYAAKCGTYQSSSLISEGFIHCSDIHKIVDVANQYFRGVRNLVLLVIDEDKVLAEIKWEDLGGFNYEYPHIYGPLNLDAVISVQQFDADENGCFRIPENLE
jgi:uncharacterized protein (DUF952 family)